MMPETDLHFHTDRVRIIEKWSSEPMPETQLDLDPRTLDHAGISAELLHAEPLLAEKIARTVPLEEHEAGAMLVEVLRFLNLIVWSGQKLTPPRPLDLAWHELILFTRTYASLCDRCFGRFIHHQPGGSEEENSRQLRTTLKLYGLFFGPPDRRFWGEHGYWSEPTACGGCDSQ